MWTEQTIRILGLASAGIPIAAVLGARLLGAGASTASAYITDTPQLPEISQLADAPPSATDSAGTPSPFWTRAQQALPQPVFNQPRADTNPREPATPEFRLTSILANGKNPIAVIDGKPCRKGDTTASGWMVESIDPDARIVRLSAPDGRSIEITLSR